MKAVGYIRVSTQEQTDSGLSLDVQKRKIEEFAQFKNLTLVEVATSDRQPLPKKRRLLSYPIQGERSDSLECANGVCYETSFQLEKVRPDVFWTFQQELSADSISQGLFHRFATRGRLAVGAISWVNVETRTKSLLLQAFHTFPEEFAIVKSQSIFQLP